MMIRTGLKFSSRALFALVAGVSLAGASSAHAASGKYGEPLWLQERLEVNSYLRTPSLIEGQFRVETRDGSPVAVARGYVQKMASTLGLKNPSEELSVLKVIARDEVGNSHVRFQQKIGGLPVFGAEMIVHMKGDTVYFVNGNFLPSQKLSTHPVVGGLDATGLAMDYVKDLMNQDLIDASFGSREEGLVLDRAPQLVFFNPGILSGETTGTSLAWSISVSGYQLMVSAMTGKVLDGWDNMQTSLNREVFTAKNTTNLPGTSVCKEGSGCSTNDADANGAFDQFKMTWDYFKNTHNRDSYDNKGAKLNGSVHYSQNFVNAYWDGTQMVFGDDMVATDVTAHELSHAVCQYTANLTYKSQSGALNESYSDVYGVMVDRDDWTMGEELPIGAIRSFSDPGAYNQPKDMTEYKNYKFYDNGGVHINSGIPNYAAYLLSDGGTNQGVKVTGQGRDKVEKIWYLTETTLLTSSSQFKDFANAAVKACGTLYGSSSVTCKETTNAFKAVKIL